jgi:uncharacterized tellurite resistance protein B-like protein
MMDDSLEATEEKIIVELLQRKFECTRVEAMQLLQMASAETEDHTRFYYYAKTLKDRLNETGRKEISAMLWDVAYADGVLHDYEASLVQRVSGMLNVAERDCEQMRVEAEVRLQRQNAGNFPEGE